MRYLTSCDPIMSFLPPPNALQALTLRGSTANLLKLINAIFPEQFTVKAQQPLLGRTLLAWTFFVRDDNPSRGKIVYSNNIDIFFKRKQKIMGKGSFLLRFCAIECVCSLLIIIGYYCHKRTIGGCLIL